MTSRGLHAAAASAALRVINENIGAALLAGTDPREFADAPEHVAHAIRTATGGYGGPGHPVASVGSSSPPASVDRTVTVVPSFIRCVEAAAALITEVGEETVGFSP
ncbi:hypothetical protein [Streptomyces vastus]|uniref:Uncharacterized protein n=1 Tax=Streptomyces vastus TaxID=285451 RepID=A0ABN3RJI9_9ACTN